jgi:hypothetical protein
MRTLTPIATDLHARQDSQASAATEPTLAPARAATATVAGRGSVQRAWCVGEVLPASTAVAVATTPENEHDDDNDEQGGHGFSELAHDAGHEWLVGAMVRAPWLQDEHNNQDDDQESSESNADTHECLLPLLDEDVRKGGHRRGRGKAGAAATGSVGGNLGASADPSTCSDEPSADQMVEDNDISCSIPVTCHV